MSKAEISAALKEELVGAVVIGVEAPDTPRNALVLVLENGLEARSRLFVVPSIVNSVDGDVISMRPALHVVLEEFLK